MKYVNRLEFVKITEILRISGNTFEMLIYGDEK